MTLGPPRPARPPRPRRWRSAPGPVIGLAAHHHWLATDPSRRPAGPASPCTRPAPRPSRPQTPPGPAGDGQSDPGEYGADRAGIPAAACHSVSCSAPIQDHRPGRAAPRGPPLDGGLVEGGLQRSMFRAACPVPLPLPLPGSEALTVSEALPLHRVEGTPGAGTATPRPGRSGRHPPDRGQPGHPVVRHHPAAAVPARIIGRREADEVSDDSRRHRQGQRGGTRVPPLRLGEHAEPTLLAVVAGQQSLGRRGPRRRSA